MLSGVKQGLSESCVGGREKARKRKRLSQNWISDCQSVSRLHALQSRGKCAACLTVDLCLLDIFERQEANLSMLFILVCVCVCMFPLSELSVAYR